MISDDTTSIRSEIIEMMPLIPGTSFYDIKKEVLHASNYFLDLQNTERYNKLLDIIEKAKDEMGINNSSVRNSHKKHHEDILNRIKKLASKELERVQSQDDYNIWYE